MENYADATQTVSDGGLKSLFAIGFWAASGAFVALAGNDVAPILQIAGALKYPWDAIPIYGFSLGIAPPFLLALLALHYATPTAKRIWSHAAILFKESGAMPLSFSRSCMPHT